MAARPFTTKAVHWTPRRIRAALKCPKPTGAIDRVYAFEDGSSLRPWRKADDELRLLQHFADNADLLDVPARPLEDFTPAVR